VSRQITYLLIADGGTDRALIPIIDWTIRNIDPEVDILEPDFLKRHGPVKNYVEGLDSGAMLIFVHRDAEGETLAERLREFDDVSDQRVIPVIPVRMSESWLLIDGSAIAAAADRPFAMVTTPAVTTLEGLFDPKSRLEDLLVGATGGLTGRSLKRFKQSLVDRRIDVSRRIEDYGLLDQLPAFQEFRRRLKDVYPYGGNC